MLSSTTQTQMSFLDAETAGGDELRALSAATLSHLLTEALVAAEAEKASWEGRSGRELRASMRLVDRAEAIACRLHEYVGYAMADLQGHAPFGCSHRS